MLLYATVYAAKLWHDPVTDNVYELVLTTLLIVSLARHC